ncbi:MAG: TIR domain-containing protein, partial [Dehalococcoidia bacterium]
MKVFISWSGSGSRELAHALRDWLPAVIQDAEPFVSSKDIASGAVWQHEIAEQLEDSDFGIVCVTPSNQGTPWINFEAGALAKRLGQARVVPLAFGMKVTDIEPPLGQFQTETVDEEGISRMLSSVNQALPDPLSDEIVARAATTWWPQLQEDIERIDLNGDDEAVEIRSEKELLEEVLTSVRSLVRASQPHELAFTGVIMRLRDVLLEFEPDARISVDEAARLVVIASENGLASDIQEYVVEICRGFNVTLLEQAHGQPAR